MIFYFQCAKALFCVQFFEEKTLSENEAEKNECQKIKTIVEENNFRLEDLSKAIEIMKVLQKG